MIGQLSYQLIHTNIERNQMKRIIKYEIQVKDKMNR